MKPLSLFQRRLNELKTAAPLSELVSEQFLEDEARRQLAVAGITLVETDPAHDLLLCYMRRDLKEKLRELCARIDETHAASKRTKKGRPTTDYRGLMIMNAAFKHVRSLHTSAAKAEKAAAMWLGFPVTKRRVYGAVKRASCLALSYRKIGMAAVTADALAVDLLEIHINRLVELSTEIEREKSENKTARKVLRFASFSG